MPSNKPTDDQLLQMLTSENQATVNSAFKLLYSEYWGLIESLVLKNNGTEDDVGTVYNDALLILHRKVNEPDFKLTATLKTFLYSIARNLWLAALRKRKNRKEVELEKVHEHISVEDTTKTELNEKEQIVATLFSKIGEDCKTILQQYYYFKWRMKQIAEDLGIKEDAAKNRKSRCLKKLRNIAGENGLF